MPSDRHWLSDDVLAARRRALAPVRVDSRSLHVSMRDGVRIAIDVHVPAGPGIPDRMPVILRQTRYLRALDARSGFKWLAAQLDLDASTRRAFLGAGYVWVDVDVRGTGASGGCWRAPWFDDEVQDGAELVSWTLEQPWSSGRVGSLGISYDGTCAEMLLVNRHPAVRAVAPLFSLHDIYADVAFPGGIHLDWFTDRWSRFNALLDQNDYARAISQAFWLMARARVASTNPRFVHGWLGEQSEESFRLYAARLIHAAIRGAKSVEGSSAADPILRAGNLDVHRAALDLVFRDDTGMHPAHPDRTLDSLSPHHYRRELEESGAAIYSYSGWRDGAYANSAAKRWRSIRNEGSRLTLGPWAHTGKLRIHAFALGAKTEFDHAIELLDFFDEHLKGVPSIGDRAPVHYFVMGEERWRASSSWPPPRVRREVWHLAPGRVLHPEVPAGAHCDAYDIDPKAGTGERSRWRSLLALVPGDYPDRRARDEGLIWYESPALADDLAIAGTPSVSLFLAWSDPNAARIFAYLEDVAPDGRVNYVTEGQLAAMHRKQTFRRADAAPVPAGDVIELTFDLLPIAYLWKRAHRIRLALASTDADHFAPLAATGTGQVHMGAGRPSRLELPVDPQR